ncbi:hypothetical protein AEGHOMDF_3193 [Methylobacterium soli]|nr:hypothetical protein AEGHOMDF_3193 [Methylobacterium soli]
MAKQEPVIKTLGVNSALDKVLAALNVGNAEKLGQLYFDLANAVHEDDLDRILISHGQEFQDHVGVADDSPQGLVLKVAVARLMDPGVNYRRTNK